MSQSASVHFSATLKSAVMMRAPSAASLPVRQLDCIAFNTVAYLPRIEPDHPVEHQQVYARHNNAGAHPREPHVASQRINMYVTIDTKWVTALRHLVVNTFSDIVLSIRIQPVDHAKKMKVCLSFSHPIQQHNKVNVSIEERLMTAIMRTLPSAEFGRISCV